MEMRRGLRTAAADSLLHRPPSGGPLSRLARLEMGARRSPCSTAHRLRRRVCAPQDTEMLPASNFACEFGECVRPTYPMLGGVVMLACLLRKAGLALKTTRAARLAPPTTSGRPCHCCPATEPWHPSAAAAAPSSSPSPPLSRSGPSSAAASTATIRTFGRAGLAVFLRRVAWRRTARANRSTFDTGRIDCR